MDALENIRKLLHKCDAGDFKPAAINLLGALGYDSERDFSVPESPEKFLQMNPKVDASTKGAEKFKESVKSVHPLFQFTEDEIPKAQKGLLPDSLKAGFSKDNDDSFLFFAVELKGKEYTRSEYVTFTREINKQLNIPSIVLFRCGNAGKRRVTLSFVGRRPSKTNDDFDVLGRVSLLREIICDLQNQHRGHLDILEELTLDKRLDWMGKNKTGGFEGLLAAWLDELDAEALNQRFYSDLQKWFEHAIKKAKFPAGKVTKQQQVVRMISRLLFIWFMKEKRLICDDLFNEVRMHEVLKDYDAKGDSYYRAILQNLFFATLNTEIDKRNFSDASQKTHRDYSLYRYKDLMQKGKHEEVLDMMKETPFVNGGLFDCLDDFEGVGRGGKRVDCFTDNKTQREELSVPNSLFFGEKGVFNIFEKYKFTVEENTPIEQEVALDPELLGKVFEEFLGEVAMQEASKKPSNRKETGSYYTPRIIVDYMVRESLAAYFSQTIKADSKKLHERIRRLLSAEVEYEVLPESEKLSDSESEQFVTTMGELRLLDPAVGSGAFPMGALQQMTMALKRVDSYNDKLKKRELARAESFEVKEIRDKARKEVNEVFSRKKTLNSYGRKLSLIRDCLFGVDVQTIAVQICRLRFFISLLIEQEVDKEKDNFGIRPLPNIDAKIIAADTLIRLGGSSGQHELYSDKVKKLREKIWAIRRRFFDAKTRQEKIECRNDDQKSRQELAVLLVSSVGREEAQKIADWDLYDQNSVAGWFDSTWIFGVEDGFNIVIGNPPYVQLQKDEGKLANKYQPVGYESFARSGDIYCLFYERGIDLLQQGGHLCYITSNKWMQSGYGEKMRKFFLKNNPLLLVDCGSDIFEAIVKTNILLLQNAANANMLYGLNLRNSEERLTTEIITEQVQKNSVRLDVDSLRDGKAWVIDTPNKTALTNKIEQFGTLLKDWDISINYGIKTGYNEAFIVDKNKRQEILDACVDEAERNRTAAIIKSVLRGKDIKRYCPEWAGLYLIYSYSGINLEQYPQIEKHLYPYKEFLEKRTGGARKTKDGRKIIPYKWYELQVDYYSSGTYNRFSKEKIVWGNMSTTPRFAIDKRLHYINAPTNIMVGRNLKYLLSVLNSKLGYYCISKLAYSREQGYMEYKKIFVEQISIPKITKENQATVTKIEKLANEILSAKAKNAKADTTSTESEIDNLVYKLYNLTKDEIAIIEGAN